MTRKHNRTGSVLLLISLILISVFSSCKAGPVGIFASIAQETDINKSRTAAFDGTSPDFVGKLGDNYYTIINGTIWSRAVTGGSWQRVAPPTGVAQGEASSAAIAGTNLYVVFGKIGDSAQKIFTRTATPGWTQVDGIFTSSAKTDGLLSANDVLFAVTRIDAVVDSAMTTRYSVHYLNGGSFSTAGPAVTEISGRPTAAAYDGLAAYWITAGASVYSGSLGSMTSVAATPSDTFAGVVREPSGYMILSSRTGKLYKYDSVWTASSAFEKSDKPHSFSAPVIVDDGAKKFLLIGTVYGGTDAATASGYLEFDIPGTGFNPATASASIGSDFADVVNFQTSVSSNFLSALNVAAEDAGKLRVFALTVGNGLWSNYFDGTDWDGWARE